MHPWDRLNRRVTGQHLWEPSAVTTVLFARERELFTPRTILGGVRAARESKVRRSTLTAEPRPNAPLLMRLWRSPYRLHTAEGRRSAMREPVPWAALHRLRFEPIPALARVDFPNPVLENRAMRDWSRGARPTVDAWLASRGGAR